ncbi:MAG: hypothetical protein ACKOCM_08775 [Cyanobacteriota bacterium]
MDDEAQLAALRERGAHLPLPLRLLALLGALAFVMLGLASVLVPLRFQPSGPSGPSPSRSTPPQA